VGEKSCQAMPSLFAGITVQQNINLLWRNPLNSFEGLARSLVDSGYRTVYFHGSDLSFEQQRDFLRMVGYETFVEQELDASVPTYACGYADEEMFSRLRSWVEDLRERQVKRPYLATLFTLSTHDPYIIPENWGRKFTTAPPVHEYADDWNRLRTREAPEAVFRESLAYLDHQLGEFYRWYREVERPRGTILILVGDHVPLVDQKIPDTPAPSRFLVPLIVSGIDPERYRFAQNRLGSQTDVPATMRYLLGMDPGRCDQGLNLLAEEADWPSDRYILTLSGSELEENYVWSMQWVVRFNRATRRTYVYAGDRQLSDAAAGAIMGEAERFRALSHRIGSFLAANDAFSPRSVAPEPSKVALPAVKGRVIVDSFKIDAVSVERKVTSAEEVALRYGFERGFVRAVYTGLPKTNRARSRRSISKGVMC
jgi:hypothetical protein